MRPPVGRVGGDGSVGVRMRVPIRVTVGMGVGFWIAVAVGLLTFYRIKINPLFVIIALIPIGIDGGLQLVTNYESNNVLRLMTGFLAGAALAMLIAHFMFVLQEDNEKRKRCALAEVNEIGKDPDGEPEKVR